MSCNWAKFCLQYCNGEETSHMSEAEKYWHCSHAIGRNAMDELFFTLLLN